MRTEFVGEIAAERLCVATLITARGHGAGRGQNVRDEPRLREVTAQLLKTVCRVLRAQIREGEANLLFKLVRLRCRVGRVTLEGTVVAGHASSVRSGVDISTEHRRECGRMATAARRVPDRSESRSGRETRSGRPLDTPGAMRRSARARLASTTAVPTTRFQVFGSSRTIAPRMTATIGQVRHGRGCRCAFVVNEAVVQEVGEARAQRAQDFETEQKQLRSSG
jgi:hypothetical protein